MELDPALLLLIRRDIHLLTIIDDGRQYVLLMTRKVQTDKVYLASQFMDSCLFICQLYIAFRMTDNHRVQSLHRQVVQSKPTL